jgi:hypothetical protein
MNTETKSPPRQQDLRQVASNGTATSCKTTRT